MGVQGGVAARGIVRGLRAPPAQGFPLRFNERPSAARRPALAAVHPWFCLMAPCGKHCCFPFLTRGARGGTAVNDLNRVQLIGHVGHDPEVKYTEQGTARTTFSVATSQRWKDADGQVQEATEWTRCVAWGILG